MQVGAGVQPAQPRRIRRLHVALAAICAVAIGAGAALLVHSLNTKPTVVAPKTYGLYGQATWAAGARLAPAITTLHDQTGARVSLASLRGRTIAMTFFDSHCHAECPLEGRALSAAERALPASERPVLVAVSINPFDNPASARRAARAWGLAAAGGWHWLMGTRRELAPVWKAYGVYVSAHPVNGDIEHTEALMLIDRRGYERSYYLYPFGSRFVTADLRTLARGTRG
jgi:cytochrome oxidase Cu insertion factor (SCO1/SenC/PrrC family)